MNWHQSVDGQARSNSHASSDETQLPLAVDLDGTLIRSDLLLESFLRLIKQDVLAMFLVPLWLLRGKAYLKEQIAHRVDLDTSELPYHVDFLAYLNEQRARGRSLILATASHRKYAEQIAAHLKLFDCVIATDQGVNMSGESKCSRLIEEFGHNGFDYAGNSYADLCIWRDARRAVLVNPDAGLLARVSARTKIERIFPRETRIYDYVRCLRVHQWVKNLLLFVPLFASHQAGNIQLLFNCVIAFAAFGLVASSSYVLNDVLDASSDRMHPRKRNRPIAAGKIPIAHAVFMVVGLLGASLAISLFLSALFVICLAFYYFCTCAYSFKLKNFAILDVCVLAALYTIRIIAGAAAIAGPTGFWLLAFGMFLFLSLALVKRYSELVAMALEHRKHATGRGYQVGDLPVIQALGTSSALVAVLVLALYMNSPEIAKLYGRPEVIWLLCPLFLYWIGRIWMITHRGDMHDDPIVFTFRDSTSLLVGLLCTVIVLAAI